MLGKTRIGGHVDRASLGKPDPPGIGGILIDHQGFELSRFSKSVGITDSNMVECLAIREVFVLFMESPRVSNSSLVIESDSRNAIKWVINPESVPWKARQISNHIENLKQKGLVWRIVYMYRESNSVADRLAKDGVNRSSDLIVKCGTYEGNSS
ncbi:hypothetical protein PTKIN_Ptkin04bG0044400 [Pterospermum kingtungense]